MVKKAIVARVEFYNFLSHYCSIVNKLLGFCSNHLSYALEFANSALMGLPITDGIDHLKQHRDQILKMQKQIKAYKLEIDTLSNKINETLAYCKEKENESIITIRPISRKK